MHDQTIEHYTGVNIARSFTVNAEQNPMDNRRATILSKCTIMTRQR